MRTNNENINSNLIFVAVCLLISVFVESRAFAVGYLVSGSFLLVLKYPLQRRKIIITGTLLLLLLITVSVFFIKTDSSLGRVLVYKITYNLFKDHWLNGVGLGKFNLNYLYYQENYFKTQNYTQKELLLADNTQHAFNDYWQFILETGVKSIVFLFCTILIITTCITKVLKSDNNFPFLLLFAIAQLTSISVAALFTHVFEQFIIQVVFITAVFVVIAFLNLTKIKLVIGLGLVCILLISYYHWGFYFKNYNSYQKLKNAQELYHSGFITESLNGYRQLFVPLKNDPAYLVNYAAVLSTYGNNLEAELILQHLLTIECSSNYYDQLAICYIKNHKPKKAEQAYITAIYMVPNRFAPRYHLFNFYVKTRQLLKAKFVGKEILALPVKIASPVITNIKAVVIAELKNIYLK